MNVMLANPLKTRMIAEDKIKTDKVDSEILAHLPGSNRVPESYVPSSDIEELRKLVRERVLLKKITTSIRNYIYTELLR
jgi:transposase